MRISSLHPKHLDTKGLVALWRETLLAQYVLTDKTKGYKNHPQLIRFKALKEPGQAINEYLTHVYQEATKRGYKFDVTKIDSNFLPLQLTVNSEQVNYEKKHLLNKLEKRDSDKFMEVISEQQLELHPMFTLIEGPIEDWEIV